MPSSSSLTAALLLLIAVSCFAAHEPIVTQDFVSDSLQSGKSALGRPILLTRPPPRSVSRICICCLPLRTDANQNYSYYLMQHAEDQPHREGWVKVCQRHCHLDGGMGIHKEMVSACGPYVHEMPKPKM